MKNWLSTLVVVGLAVLAMGWVWADEESELRERVERERVEAEKAERLEAELREREAVELREQAREIERMGDALRRELEAALEKREALLKRVGEDHPEVRELSEQIEVIQRELDAHANHRRDRPHREENEREGFARRIEHLHAAAGHLDEAGMPEMARELRGRAEDMERELHRQHPEEGIGRHLDELHGQLRDMRAEIEKLRDEVAELRKQSEKPGR